MAKHKTKVKEKQRQQWLTERSKKKTVRHNTAANQEKRRADWQPLQADAFGVVADRRIMPRDEKERRKRMEALSAQVVTDDFDASFWVRRAAETPYALGVVAEVSRGLCRVAINNEVQVCEIRGTLIAEGTSYTNVLTVGDRVLVSSHEGERGVVEEVLPRRSGLGRADPFYGHLRQLLAANVDQVLIVAAWRELHIWLKLMDEYLIGAERNNLKAFICINKIDLAKDRGKVEMLLGPYVNQSIPLLLTSAVTGEGMVMLTAVLRGKTTVLAGLSGVGKSTLLNSIVPGLNLRTGRMSNMPSREGRHTTTQAVMYPLYSVDGYVIDTPGIKDMGLLGLEPDEPLDFYPDLATYVARCRFSNCTHNREPGCAVLAALHEGAIMQWRYENYLKLYSELAS